MLLVLDDVWPGSEALVEKVKIDIPDYKILVTSRIEYPRFGTKILLGQLDHNQAVALFTHYAKLNENSLYRPEEDLLHVDELPTNGKVCFMDLGLFPQDQRIHVPALIDMWPELHNLNSDDETFNSDWIDMKPFNTEVLILNLQSSQYTLPRFTKKMKKLKVLIVTNYGFDRSEIKKFELLGSLSNLKRIRLEKVSVPSLCILKNLQKLSLRMCNTRQAFENCSIQISNAMPNLVEMSIDYCKDLITLPDALCKITPLKKLSITNCHNLSVLPQDIGKLENLEVLRLCSCSDLVEMPNSVKGLNKLSCLDISDCVSLTKLPDDIGELKKLKKLVMKETATLWENFRAFPNLKIEIFRGEIDLKWLHGVHS
ncbi:hypothetical protein JHK84_030416 [Glycine max]|nr:hypothetical protein JHK86_030282 [Glycine max]KAG5144873.1 hypothetical protein JHK84_030416 [Glycine max]